MALETSEMDRYGLHLSYKKKSGWIPMLLRRFMIANVHFVMRALDFPCLSFEYKDNTMEIQRKCNGNPSHARQSARLLSEKHVKSIFLSYIFLDKVKCSSRPGDRQNGRRMVALDLARLWLFPTEYSISFPRLWGSPYAFIRNYTFWKILNCFWICLSQVIS